MSQTRTRDFSWIVAAYVVAGVAAVLCGYLLAGLPGLQKFAGDPLYLSAAADIVATLVIFAFSRAFNNSSFYDAYWSVIPPLLVGYWCWAYTAMDLRLLLVWLLVWAWAIRLTHNWARGWQGLGHVDWRYIDLKEQTGWAYPLVDLLGIQLLPTVLVFVGCVPVWLLVVATAEAQVAPLGLLDLIWLVVGAAAVYLEFRADNVLRAFRLDPANAGLVLRHDVWAWCRHPNYLGEIGFWLALALAGYLNTGSWWAWLGFGLMVGLFIGITIPMIDKRQLANKSDYQAYKRQVFALLPTPPRRAD